ncbi:PD-(D/E)XK nuclease superfamily protein [Neorickettsia helminthoeca str. Oregon]|uniref:PD-(D/E)XK nuclease superfamily protein n=1 Tax=Neorickettsia helminthoeca str. Oregon TaxID=1286528 RepID=X5GWM2_9RICK|nr:PD-(D/E)XK nuclease family protein [Neorickettsia helminthoeca]AHX11442.1 PD-(D/E)XK nuclease superfamily protein [Neorickettsia helminthoeca str. Oregon]
MLYNIDIRDNIYDSILCYLYNQNSSDSRDYSHCLILTPNYSFSYSLKKKFRDGMVLPMIADCQKIIERFALEQQNFEYINFRTKAIIAIYKFLRNIGHHCSISEAALLLTKLEDEENYTDIHLLGVVREQLKYLTEYKEFQKLALSDILNRHEQVIIAGIYVTDATSEHIYRKSIEHNYPIFIQGLVTDENYHPDPNHFLYKTWKFYTEEPITIIDQNKDLDDNFFPRNSSSTSFDTRYEIKIYQTANDYHQLKEAEKHLLNLFPDVALVTKNQMLLRKIQLNLNHKGISLFFREKYKVHPDGIFLLKLIDLALLGSTDENIIALLKHRYIYKYNSSIVDEIEKSLLRTIKIDARTLEKPASTYLESIKKAAEQLSDAENLAKYHLEWANSLTDNLDLDSKKILRLIENHLPELRDINDYKEVLTFFLENHYFYPCEKNENSIEVFSPREASFLNHKNVLLLDCTEQDFPVSDSQVMLNLFQIISTKKTVAISSKQRNLSRLLLKIQYSNQAVGELSIPLENTESLLIEKVETRKNELYIPAEMLPKKLSPTMIELLISSPYKFYMRYILGIKEVNPIGIKPGYKELGCVLHNVFRRAANEKFSKEEYKQILLDELQKYATQYPYVKNLWLPRGLKILEQFSLFHNDRLNRISTLENEKEVSISFEEFKGVEIRCRFDRIEFLDDGTVSIVEFKTGIVPTLKQIKEFIKPQLLIQGLVLQRSQHMEISELLYCKPSVDKIVLRQIAAPMQEIESCQYKLKELLRHYLSGNFNFCEENTIYFAVH